MKLSAEGLRLIKSFEGYHTKQPDGSAKAYLCPANVWTCGWGCTAGVGPNTHWSEAEATEKLAEELQKFEAAVLRHSKIPLNQNQFDALVSFAYNCGEGALARSTLLKRVNNSQFEKAAKEFQKWNRGGGRVLKGLVARRAREAALFLKPVEAPETPVMPQSVSPTVKPSRPAVAAATLMAGLATPLPTVPPFLTETVTNAEAWKSIGGQIWTLTLFAQAQPILAGVLVFGLVSYVLVPQRWFQK